MFWPVVSATATMIGLPADASVAGYSGQVRQSYFPITLIIILSSSMVVALMFLPVLGGMFGKGRRTTKRMRKPTRHRKRATGMRFRASPAGMRVSRKN